jgi:hypothetical protein
MPAYKHFHFDFSAVCGAATAGSRGRCLPQHTIIFVLLSVSFISYLLLFRVDRKKINVATVMQTALGSFPFLLYFATVARRRERCLLHKFSSYSFPSVDFICFSCSLIISHRKQKSMVTRTHFHSVIEICYPFMLFSILCCCCFPARKRIRLLF